MNTEKAPPTPTISWLLEEYGLSLKGDGTEIQQAITPFKELISSARPNFTKGKLVLYFKDAPARKLFLEEDIIVKGKVLQKGSKATRWFFFSPDLPGDVDYDNFCQSIPTAGKKVVQKGQWGDFWDGSVSGTPTSCLIHVIFIFRG